MNQDKVIYLKGLNGLRAIAAISVVISHSLSTTFGDFGVKSNFRLPLAEFGVTLFFVISGFLITFLLLNEQKKSNEINIRKFYLRRVLRIWPIYYLVIFSISIISFLTLRSDLADFRSLNLMWYLFFAANIPFIFSSGISLIVHFWSIAVEEHFYLIWPWFIKFSKTKLLEKIYLSTILLITIKLLLWLFIGKGYFMYRFISVTRIHCMMIGAIGSILYYKKHRLFNSLLSNKWTQRIAWILFISMGIGLHSPAVIAHEVFAVISLIIIIGQVSSVKDNLYLENSILSFLGKISYGMYVYHTLVIFILARYIKVIDINKNLKLALTLISVIGITIFISHLSYEFFEKYFIRLKSTLAVIKSTNEPQRC